jgi:GTP-binding protein
VACVVLVGRPNVGKSSLFNRIAGGRRAIVEPTPGVTRDPLRATAEWAGRRFELVDTGGLVGPPGDPLAAEIGQRAEEAIAGADVAVMVVDGQAGLLPADREVAEHLRRWGGPVLLAVNKCEGWRTSPHEFYALGLGEPLPVSAIHGDGVAELLDAVIDRLPAGAAEGPQPTAGAVRVALVGRPNAGKSSLVNRLLGRQQLIVSDLPGTTRDAIDVPWSRDGHHFVFVDTPGLRRPARVAQAAELERLSVARALRAVARADVAVLVLDAQVGVTEQDQRIAGFAYERVRAAVVLLNKWDLVPSGTDGQQFVAAVRAALPLGHYALVERTSARTGLGLARLPRLLGQAAAAHAQQLPTAAVNRVLREAVALHAPPAHKGRPLRLFYATQVATRPPTLLCFVNLVEAVRPDYVRYLENRLREAFDLQGSPLRLHFRARSRQARTPVALQRTGMRRPG